MTRFVLGRRARALAVAAALLAPSLAACSFPAQASRSALDPAVGPRSFAPLVKAVEPAVVNIRVTADINAGDALTALLPELRGTPYEKRLRERMRQHRELLRGAGSGFILDPSGIVVTNNHVVEHADKIVVALNDGTELPAKVVGADQLTDIAVLRIQAPKPLPHVGWGDSRQVEVGDWIIAAGNPFGLGPSVSAGIVSARGRDIGAGPFDDFLQLDAPINPGNSGGPTFNMAGEVVGLNTAILSPSGGSVGIGFAIPSEIASRVVAELREKGHIDRGWLGVAVMETPAASKIAGVKIAGVDRGGPAARAGLKPGDVVLAVNGDRVDTARGLIRAIAAAAPGSKVTLTVLREGRQVEVPVTVGLRPPTSAG
jgi:serine protease Do